MFKNTMYEGNLKERYALLNMQLKAMLENEPNTIANLANTSALLNNFLDDINWVGFYILENNELVLGPFQGLPACVRIPVGKGVCGTAVSEGEIQVVDNVHEFPGHIACDENSRSEVVIPLYIDNRIYGVLDIDSPIYNRFSNEEANELSEFANILCKHING